MFLYCRISSIWGEFVTRSVFDVVEYTDLDDVGSHL